MTDAADVETRLRALLDDPRGLEAPGFALGVFRDGRPVHMLTSGAADIASGRAIDADTRFYAASTSKQFTALALVQLVLAGEVALEDDVRTYLPEMPSYGDPVSVAMLLNHTGGVREPFALLLLAGCPELAAATRADALHVVLRQRDANFRPGTRFDYTNGGYLLLSEIVERVTREPFAAYVDRAVLKPLGMERSFILAGERPHDANMSRGYGLSEGRPMIADSYPLYGGSGGLVTTLNDLARYDYDIDTGHRVWAPAVAELMLRPGRYADGRVATFGRWGQAYASGLVVGPQWVSHAGSVPGFKCNHARLASRRLGVALLSNRGEVNAGEMMNAVVAVLGEDLPPVAEVAAPSLRGLYASEDLDVVYEVGDGGEVLRVEVLPARGRPARQTFTLRRVDDGSYMGQGVRLVPDEAREGFRMETPQISLAFERAE